MVEDHHGVEALGVSLEAGHQVEHGRRRACRRPVVAASVTVVDCPPCARPVISTGFGWRARRILPRCSQQDRIPESAGHVGGRCARFLEGALDSS